jgi:hypothetical protein
MQCKVHFIITLFNDRNVLLGADCNADYYLVVAKVRDRLSVSKQEQTFYGERFNLKRINELEVRKQHQIEIKNKFETLESLSDDKDVNKVWDRIKENIKTSAKKSLGLREM